jgi:hypothetical protein
MAEYRAFAVGKNGHFFGFEPIVCDTDEQAIETAKRLLHGLAIEVWSAERMVARLPTEETDAVSHEIRNGRMIPKTPS